MTKATVAEVAERLRMPPGTDKMKVLYARNANAQTVVESLGRGDKIGPKSIESAVKPLADLAGNALGDVLSWTVPSDGVYFLTVNNKPFIVTRFTCSFGQIAWRAGQGFPLYTTRCPRTDFSPDQFFRDAFLHSIVPGIANLSYGIGCLNPSPYEFQQGGQLYVGVNDDDYADNQGAFEFVVYNYS